MPSGARERLQSQMASAGRITGLDSVEVRLCKRTRCRFPRSTDRPDIDPSVGVAAVREVVNLMRLRRLLHLPKNVLHASLLGAAVRGRYHPAFRYGRQCSAHGYHRVLYQLNDEAPSSRFPNIGGLSNGYYFFEVNDALWPLTALPRQVVSFPVARKCGFRQSLQPKRG